MLWQKGLVEREINELLRGLAEQENQRNKSHHRRKSKVNKDDTLLLFYSRKSNYFYQTKLINIRQI